MGRNDGFGPQDEQPPQRWEQPPQQQQQQREWAPSPAERPQPKSTLALITDAAGSDRGLKRLQMALPAGTDPQRFILAWVSGIKATPKAAECTRESLEQSFWDCARLGLWPGPAQHVDIIPYGQSAQTQVGWKGVVALLKRDAGVAHVTSRPIYEHEEYTIRAGTSPGIDHLPKMVDRGDRIAWYAVAFFRDGSQPAFEVMTEQEVQQHKKQYRSSRSGPWDDAYHEMARKTVIKRLAKHVGAGDVLAHALRLDTTTALDGPAQTDSWDRNDTQQAIRERMKLEDGRQK
jgi:recombination protein RecT